MKPCLKFEMEKCLLCTVGLIYLNFEQLRWAELKVETKKGNKKNKKHPSINLKNQLMGLYSSDSGQLILMLAVSLKGRKTQ